MKNSTFLNGRWIVVSGYVAMLFIITPLLPDLIKWAGSIWSGEAVKHFVLGFELVLGALLLMWAGALFFLNGRRFLQVGLIVAGIIAMSCGFYHFAPNPYELIHLPEYATLAILLFRAVRSSYGQWMPNRKLNCLVGSIVLGISLADELFQGILPNRFFGWRDFLLNGLGGVLGLVVVWGTGNRQKTLNRRERREQSKSEDGEP